MRSSRRREGHGNDGLWKARKTVVLFSALPTNLGNRWSRFPHSHGHGYDEISIKKRRKSPAVNVKLSLNSARGL